MQIPAPTNEIITVIQMVEFMMDYLIMNLEAFDAEQIASLRRILAEKYARVDDYWHRHLD